jgi:hypothetical protein
MKTLLIPIVVLAFSIVPGCGEDAPKKKPREGIVGKKTQQIVPVETLLAKPGAQVANTTITATDPLTLSGQAYVTQIDRIAGMAVQQAVEIYNATNGEYPKNFQVFMDEVIRVGKPDGIWLPELPDYQKYGYDEKEHKLVVVEYPELKKELIKKQTE